MYRLNKDTILTPEMIVKYIEKDQDNERRLKKLYDYYIGKHDINKRFFNDGSKPNNKVVNPYAEYITTMMSGYFMGEPVKYSSYDDELLEVIKANFNYNDEAAENTELAKNASIYGIAYELMYLDEDKQLRFKSIPTVGCIPIVEKNIEEDLLYLIRYYDEENILTGDTVRYVEVYSRTYYQLYKMNYSALTLLEETQHYWGLVPVNMYFNNSELIGDFETVISLIDSYDKMESDSLNEMEYFSDAYLALYGMEGTEAEDVAQMKENRVLIMPEDARAEWLIKQINDTYLENEKSRLDKNIHKFSFCPPMTDSDFASNASGVAMKYKLMGLENATSKKESFFKKGLQRRLELITNMLNIMGNVYDYRAINITFTRNIPSNMVEMADVVSKVGHLYSEETQMELMPFDIDIEAEKTRKEEERQNGYIDFNYPINSDKPTPLGATEGVGDNE